MLKPELQCFGHLMRRAHSLEKTLVLGKTEGGGEGDDRMGWLDSITISMDMNLSNLQEIVEDRGVWHTVHEITKNWTRLNNTHRVVSI